MKLLLDDTTARKHGLNANEACVFAAILKCTKAGRGWFSNYRDLANALPFVISASTVCRCVDKLLNMGLVEKRENTLFALLQIETKSLQNETDLLQIETKSLQNETKSDSPYNPLIINNDMKEEIDATCAHACDMRTPETQMYFDIRKIFNDKHGLHKVGEGLAAEKSWKDASPAKKAKLFEAVQSGTWDKQRLDWLIADFPEPEPHILSGFEQEMMWRNGEVPVLVKYKDRFVAVTQHDCDIFHLDEVRKILPVADNY